MCEVAGAALLQPPPVPSLAARDTITQLLPHGPPGQLTAAIPDHTTHVPQVPYVDNIHEVIKKPFVAKGPQQFAMNASNIVAPAALPFGDILANLVATFAAFGHHSLLWPKATTFEWSQRPYLQLLAAIVRYGQRPPVPSVVNTSIITQPGSSILLLFSVSGSGSRPG